MKKYLLLFATSVLGILQFTCNLQPTSSETRGNIAINLRFMNKSAAKDSRQSHLAKNVQANGIITDEVLLLHCDEGSGFIAHDASAYANDFTLYNVAWDSAATPQLGKSLLFDGKSSYALSESYEADHSELNGTLGLSIVMMVYAMGTNLHSEKRLLDRMDYNGGYTLGIADNQVFFRVRQGSKETAIYSISKIEPRTWYKIVARFAEGKLSLFINDVLAGKEVDFSGPITASYRQLVLGAGWTLTSGIPSFYFNGRIDEVSIRTTMEYVDFDLIRVAVFDLSEYSSANAFYGSDAWEKYHNAFHKFLEDTTNVITWDKWKKMFRDADLSLYSEQTLTIRGAFAQGSVRGVEGLNMLAAAGIKSGRIIYHGIGHVVAVPGTVVEATIDMWPTGD